MSFVTRPNTCGYDLAQAQQTTTSVTLGRHPDAVVAASKLSGGMTLLSILLLVVARRRRQR